MGMTLDLARVRVVSFDCYGTLIDWERGILTNLRRTRELGGPGSPDDATLLSWFSELERRLERPADGVGPHVLYRDVLGHVLGEMARRAGGEATTDEARAFADSVGDWPAFADSADSLRGLARHVSLAIVSNVDDDLFARTRRHLEPFGPVLSHIITAQQVGSYKPDRGHFDELLRRTGARREEILHAAESVYHDHEPARALGIASVWIDRRGGRGPGASGAGVSGQLPLARLGSLGELADLFDRRGG